MRTTRGLKARSRGRVPYPIRLVVAPFVLWLGAHLLLRLGSRSSPIAISHRGAAGLAPENTLVSIRRAVEVGARWIEIDVQRSADGVLVVMHDARVDRTTDGAGAIAGMTWEQIHRLDAGSSFASGFAGEPVPSLDGVLEALAGWPGTLVLEGKDPDRYPGIERDLVETLDRFGVTDRVIVVSFDHGWLSRFHRLAPEVPIGRLGLWMSPGLAEPRADFIGVYWLSVILDPTLLARAHARGEDVWVWTVNDPRLMSLLRWLGVDGITTDHPERWIYT